MKKKQGRHSRQNWFILKLVLWLITAGLLTLGIVFYIREGLSVFLLVSSAVMALVSVFVTLWLDTKAGRQYFRDEDQ